MLKPLIFIVFSLCFQSAFAQKTILPKAKNETANNEHYLLQTISKKYSQFKLVSMDVEKLVTLGVLKKQKKSSGKLHLGENSQIRFEIDKPQKSLNIINEKTAWMIEIPDTPAQKVRVIQATGSAHKKAQSILKIAFGKEDINKFFALESKKLDKDIANYSFINTDKSLEIKKLQIFIHLKNLQIEQISYWDNLNNQTDLFFSNIEFSNNLKNELFEYKAPKDAQITNIN